MAPPTDARSDNIVAAPTCLGLVFDLISPSCTISDQPENFGGREITERKLTVNCRIEMAVEKVMCVSSARANWLFAVSQSNLGDTSLPEKNTPFLHRITLDI